MQIILTILAVAKAWPSLNRWLEKLFSAWASANYESMKRENRDVILRAAISFDQREIEHLLGSKSAGKPSGQPGSEHRDTLPGVPG